MFHKVIWAVLAFLFVTSGVISAEEPLSDIELWSYIQRQSPGWYHSYIEENSGVDAGDWKSPIESAFLKLARNSGENGFNISYAIVSRDDFNAMCFPGGQFIIHSGTLGILDSLIEIQEQKSIDKIPSEDLRLMREALIAPILAHELGHYYNRHSFKSMKAQWNLSDSSRISQDLMQIRHSQENEYEADMTGYLLLRRANYDPDSMLVILNLLNLMQQEELKGINGTDLNGYLTTHPSPHSRLAALEKDPDGLNQWAANLEMAFSDIQFGTNLDSALRTVEEGLRKVPGNIYLERARATALHKKWLSSASIQQLQLKGLIDSPPFRDDMVFSGAPSRAVRKTIPGDRILYEKARDAYEKVYLRAVDSGFCSNYALILAYSPKPADEMKARELAFAAVQAEASIINASNFGMVMYLTDDADAAMEVFSELASDVSNNMKFLIELASSDQSIADSLEMIRREQEKIQAFDTGYISESYVPMLNLALCLYQEGYEVQARNVAEVYIRDYESTSSWALYLADLTDVEIPSPIHPSYLKMDGVRVMDTVGSLVEHWGSATEIVTSEDGSEFWIYIGKQAKVTILGGVVRQIELFSPDGPKPGDLFGVGSHRRDVEAVLGEPKRVSSPFIVYEGSQNVAVAYTDEIAEILVLFP